MYAIVEDSGSQIKIQKGDIFEIDHRDVDPGAELTFDRVLMIGNGEGEANVGTPYINGATVTAKVLDKKRGEKIDVIKFKRRKGYRRKTGHRQPYVVVEVTDISS